jgi:hypothetical protein
MQQFSCHLNGLFIKRVTHTSTDFYISPYGEATSPKSGLPPW